MKIADEARVLHEATNALARLDERLTLDPLAKVFESWLATREAMAIAHAESLGVQEVALVSALNDLDDTIADKAIRTARDIRGAVVSSFAIGQQSPTPEMIVSIFAKSEKSNTQRESDSASAIIDNDADYLSGILSLTTTADPWTSAQHFRTIFTGKGFKGRGRRMALMLAPWLASTGFGLKMPYAPFAIRAFREQSASDMAMAASDADTWPVYFFSKLADSAKAATVSLGTIHRLAKEARDIAGQRRTGSRLEMAILAFISMPVLSIHDLSNMLDITYGGAKYLIEELKAKGLVSPRDEKGHLFIYPQALNL